MPVLGVGVDQAWDRASVADLIAYRATFVCRYLGEDTTGKNLTASEAAGYIAAGIAVVSNYEFQPGSALKGYWEGRRIARLADQQHRACGGPASRPIYFSVDIDITNPTQMAAVSEWARGINDEIGLDRTGVYGEYEVIRTLFDAGKIRWGWQTYAWSHGQWDSRAQIRQVANGVQLAGHDVDRDEQWATDFGQWPYTGGPINMTPDQEALVVRAADIVVRWSGGLPTESDRLDRPIGMVGWQIAMEKFQAATLQALGVEKTAIDALAARPTAQLTITPETVGPIAAAIGAVLVAHPDNPLGDADQPALKKALEQYFSQHFAAPTVV